MTPEERQLLYRIDERTLSMHERHGSCLIPSRVATLENHITRIEAGIAILLFLVTAGRLIDLWPIIIHFHL